MGLKRIVGAIAVTFIAAAMSISALAAETTTATAGLTGALAGSFNGDLLNFDYKEATLAKEYGEGNVTYTFTAQMWKNGTKDAYIKLLNGKQSLIMLRFSASNSNIYVNDTSNEIVSSDYASKRLNYVINVDFSTGDYNVKASCENYSKTVSGSFGAGQKINKIAVQKNLRLYDDSITAVVPTHAEIGAVTGGEWYTYDEATGKIINKEPTVGGNEVATKINYVTVTPNDDIVTGITVTFTSENVGNGKLVPAGAVIDGNNASITKSGLHLTGESDIEFAIRLTTTNAFNGCVDSIVSGNFNKVAPTITVE